MQLESTPISSPSGEAKLGVEASKKNFKQVLADLVEALLPKHRLPTEKVKAWLEVFQSSRLEDVFSKLVGTDLEEEKTEEEAIIREIQGKIWHLLAENIQEAKWLTRINPDQLQLSVSEPRPIYQDPSRAGEFLLGYREPPVLQMTFKYRDLLAAAFPTAQELAASFPEDEKDLLAGLGTETVAGQEESGENPLLTGQEIVAALTRSDNSAVRLLASQRIITQTRLKVEAAFRRLTRVNDTDLGICVALSDSEARAAQADPTGFWADNNNKERLQKTIAQSPEVTIFSGGWTSNISYARSVDPNERDLVAQEFALAALEKITKVCWLNTGPLMGNMSPTTEVNVANPFGTDDYAQVMMTVYATLGIFNAERVKWSAHSMAGAALADVVILYRQFWEKSVKEMTAILYDPAFPAANDWSDAKLAAQRDKSYLGIIMPLVIKFGSDLIKFIDNYPQLKRLIAPVVTELVLDQVTNFAYLPGANMSGRVAAHSQEFYKHPRGAMLTCLACRQGCRIENLRDQLAGLLEVMSEELKLAIVSDPHDKMVNSEATLHELPAQLPLHNLTDPGKENDPQTTGSHYGFKEVVRLKKDSLLKILMNILSPSEFRQLMVKLAKWAELSSNQSKKLPALAEIEKKMLVGLGDVLPQINVEVASFFLNWRRELASQIEGFQKGDIKRSFEEPDYRPSPYLTALQFYCVKLGLNFDGFVRAVKKNPAAGPFQLAHFYGVEPAEIVKMAPLENILPAAGMAGKNERKEIISQLAKLEVIMEYLDVCGPDLRFNGEEELALQY